jgi:hypothetical protein
MRTIAIDWSGAKTRAHRKIWIAEARGGDLLMVECGRSREEVAAWLIEQAAHRERLVVGMDFAFSFPAWFLDQQGCATAEDLWRLAAEGAVEAWLTECAPPFWGRPGKSRGGDDIVRFRATEASTTAKSVFQIGGAGAVGTGSLRGMPILHKLRQAGFAVWPFTAIAPHQSVVLEIYPRTWSAGVRKSRQNERDRWLARPQYADVSPRMREIAASTEDAFDAAISALAMDASRDQLERLTPSEDPALRREGAIWGG